MQASTRKPQKSNLQSSLNFTNSQISSATTQMHAINALQHSVFSRADSTSPPLSVSPTTIDPQLLQSSRRAYGSKLFSSNQRRNAPAPRTRDHASAFTAGLSALLASKSRDPDPIPCGVTLTGQNYMRSNGQAQNLDWDASSMGDSAAMDAGSPADSNRNPFDTLTPDEFDDINQMSSYYQGYNNTSSVPMNVRIPRAALGMNGNQARNPALDILSTSPDVMSLGLHTMSAPEAIGGWPAIVGMTGATSSGMDTAEASPTMHSLGTSYQHFGNAGRPTNFNHLFDEEASRTALSMMEKRKKRRESHNMVERRRRDNINEKIQELGALIPEILLTSGNSGEDIGPGGKPNKGMILRKSVEYIKHLQVLVNQHSQRSKELEEEIQRLRSMTS